MSEFNTITGMDWAIAIARARKTDNSVSDQIKAAIKRKDEEEKAIVPEVASDWWYGAEL